MHKEEAEEEGAEAAATEEGVQEYTAGAQCGPVGAAAFDRVAQGRADHVGAQRLGGLREAALYAGAPEAAAFGGAAASAAAMRAAASAATVGILAE